MVRLPCFKTYDARDRKVRDTVSAGGTVHALTQTGYDAAGRPDCTAVRMNPAAFGAPPASACALGAEGTFGPDRITRTVHDGAGQRLQLRVGVGTAVEAADATWAYDLDGRVTTMIDGNGNRAALSYDGQGRQARWTFPSTTPPGAYDDSSPANALASAGAANPSDYEDYGYDKNGNRTATRLRDGRSIAFAYDALDRLTVHDIPNDYTYATDRSFAYDLLGRMTLAGNSHGVDTVMSYDGFGRKLSEGNSHHGITSFQYDAEGRRTRTTWKDGFYVAYDYLVTGEVSHIRENGAASGAGVLATFGYDSLGRRTGLTRGNGAVTSYAHDPVGRLGALGHDLAGSANDLALTFAYNPASQIVTGTRSNDAYSYTALASQNRTNNHNGLNQVTASGGLGVGHDARGNTNAIGGVSYGYTADNLLVWTSQAGHAFAHDGLGRLYYTGEPVAFGYDGDRVIAELVQTSGFPIAQRYVYGPGTDEPLVVYGAAGPAAATASLFDRAGTAVTALGGGVWQVEKVATDGTFSAAAESVESYPGDFTLEARATGAAPDGLVGMNADPATDTSYVSLDHSLQFYHDGRAYIYENGFHQGNFPVDQKLWLWRRGTTLYYGTGADLATASTSGLKRTVTGVTASLSFDSSFAAPGTRVEVRLEGAGGGGGAQRRFLHADERGSIVAHSDDAGNLAARNRYDEYGMPQGTLTGRFGYTGQAWMPLLGMWHYKSRVYNPDPDRAGGRFMQTDRIGYDGGTNLYVSYGNDPINFRDPDGTQRRGPCAFFCWIMGGPVPIRDASGRPVGVYNRDALPAALTVVAGSALAVAVTAVDVLNGPVPDVSTAVVAGGRIIAREAAENRARSIARGELPRRPPGPGSVPRSERDPRRFFSRREREAQREEQGGRCANGCGREIDASNSRGHHVDRHADGGRTDQANHAEVCIKCHDDIHAPR